MTPTPAGSLKAAIEVIPPLPVFAKGFIVQEKAEEYALTYARQYHAANSADLLARLEAAEKDCELLAWLIDRNNNGAAMNILNLNSCWSHYDVRGAIDAAIKGEAND